jgi:hypothetical protein
MTPIVEASDILTWANAGQQSSPPDSLVTTAKDIASGITRYIYWTTGRADGYFSDAPVFSEVRDGNDSYKMYVLNGPIDTARISTVTITVNGMSIPQSQGYGMGGWFVEQGGNSIAMRDGGGVQGQTPFYLYDRPFRFVHGIGNVGLTYPGGYDEVPEDLFMGALKTGTVLLNKRLREDEGSRSTPQTGSVTGYRSWAWPPEFRNILENYKRTAMVMG